MKSALFFLTALLISNSIFAQINLDHNFGQINVSGSTNLTNYGVKFYSYTTNNLILYNDDYSVFKNISIPQISGWDLAAVEYISDNLFDLDNEIEYYASYTSVN